MLCIQIINNVEMYRGVSTSLPLAVLKFARTFSCKVFTASKDERNIFEVLLNCKHINNDISN